MKSVWYYNLFEEPMNSKNGWLWNWLNLYEENPSIQKSINVAKKHGQLKENLFDSFARIVCAAMYYADENNKKFNVGEIQQVAKKEFGGLAKMNFDSSRSFVRMACLPKLKEILNHRDFAKIDAKWGHGQNNLQVKSPQVLTC